MNAMMENPEREEVSLAATETVIPPDILKDVELRQGGPLDMRWRTASRFPTWESESSTVSRMSAA